MEERERAPEAERAPELDNPKTAPPGEAVSGFPEPPGPGDQDQPADESRDPHHDLNNPVRDPDPTEWPDPYEKRPDPCAPETVDTPAMPANAETQAEAEETPKRRLNRARRVTPLILGCVLCWLVAPGIARAATVETQTGRYFYFAAHGEANALRIDADADSYTFTDSVSISDQDGGCTRLSATSLDCPRTQGTTPMDRILARLSDPFTPGDTAPNSFRYFGPPPRDHPTQAALEVRTRLTNTDDDIAGSSGPDEIVSDDGVDNLVGEDGHDLIFDGGGPSGSYAGGGGNDYIQARGAGSADAIYGGEGDDYLVTGSGQDTLLGEGGSDILESFPDRLTVGDHLDGGAGDDHLIEQGVGSICVGGTPTDVNIGGPGQDRVDDLCGVSDVFKLQDGERDEWRCDRSYASAELDSIDVLMPHPPSEEGEIPPPCKAQEATGVETEISKGPKKKTSKRTAKFKFDSPLPDATFECKLDSKKFKPCESPVKYKGLKPGKHKFQVRAIDASGNPDPSPDKYKWKITEG
jgi:hypothetical protein